jgi:hypothetical protein
MLAQFTPYVSPGDIVNLPRYRFYMKLSAVEPEEPFSGETIPIILDHDQEKIQKVIEASRKNWAVVYQKSKTTKSTTIPKRKETKNTKKPEKNIDNSLV